MRIGILVSVLLSWAISGWCSEPETNRWEPVDTGTGTTRFVAVAVDANQPNRVLAASERQVLESTDGGRSWQQRLRTPGQAIITHIALSPHSPRVLVGTNHGLHVDTNDTSTGFRMVGESDAAYTDVLFHPTAQGLALAGASDGILMSRDDGLTWSRIDLPEQARHVIDLAIDPADSTRVYAATRGGLFAGQSSEGRWERLRGDIGAEGPEVEEAVVVEQSETAEETGLLHHLSAIAVDPVNPQHLYLAGDQGIQHSPDAGGTWEPLPRSGMASTNVRHLWLQAHSPLVLYAVTTRGIASLDPTSGRWRQLTMGLTTRRINDLAGSSQTLWAATDAGLYRYDISPDPFDHSEAPHAQELLANFAHEPSIGQVRETAIRYAEVDPEKIQRWRRQAALKALLPSLDVGLDRNRSNDVGIDEGTFPNFQFIETEDRDTNWDVSVTWDLGDLIWNQDQTSIDVRSKLMVELRDDIVDEVTRTYFERRRIQIELLLDAPKTDKAVLAKELRVQELTALLDGLTGGYFSRQNRIPVEQ